MNDFKDSFVKFFHEKDYIAKFAILLSGYLFYIIASLLLDIFGTKTGSSGADVPTIWFIPFGLLFGVGWLIYLFLTAWYQYEYIQSSMYDSEAKGIWQRNWLDSFKRVGKIIVLDLVLSLPIIAVIFLAVIIDVVLIVLAPIIGILITLLSIIAVLPLVIGYQWLVVMPSYLRMIATNTFSEGFEISQNWYIGRKYWQEFLKILGYIVVVGAAMFFVGVLIGVTEFIIFGDNSKQGAVFSTILLIPFGIVALYITIIQFSYLMGSLYKNIMKSEGISLPFKS